MKILLLTIGFTLGGILTSLAQAQSIPLTIDSTQSSVEVSIGGISNRSTLSGSATLDLESADPPAGNAQITDLNLVLDDSFSVDFAFGLVTASTSPGDVTVSLVTAGDPGTISGGSFDQLANLLTLGGDLNVADPFGFAGGNQTVDLSTIEVSPFDFSSVNVTQSGNVITVSSSFTINETADLGAGPVPIVVDVTYVATGVVPIFVLLGDVNRDGTVDFLDIAPFVSILTMSEFQAEADIDQNAEIDFLDIAPFVELLSQ